MTGLGLGLGISSGGIGGGDTTLLYLLAQDGSVLQAQKNRGDDLSPSLILYEPNSGITSDALPDPTELLLTQDSNILLTEAGRWIAQNAEDRPYDRFITQGDKIILTQDGNFLVSTEVS